MRVGTKRGQWLRLASALGLALAACDTFFEFDLVVTDCVTKQPLSGVAAVTRAQDEPDHREETDAAGKASFHLNKPDQYNVTLTLTKPTYQNLTEQFRAAPGSPYRVCLEPVQP